MRLVSYTQHTRRLCLGDRAELGFPPKPEWREYPLSAVYRSRAHSQALRSHRP